MNILKTLLRNKENEQFDATLKKFFPHVLNNLQSMDKLGFAPPPSRRNYGNDEDGDYDQGSGSQQALASQMASTMKNNLNSMQNNSGQAQFNKDDMQLRRAAIMAMVAKKKMEAMAKGNMNRIGN